MGIGIGHGRNDLAENGGFPPISGFGTLAATSLA